MEFIFSILWILAWIACIMLFTIPQIWGAFFTISLLGHLTQFLPGNGNKRG